MWWARCSYLSTGGASAVCVQVRPYVCLLCKPSLSADDQELTCLDVNGCSVDSLSVVASSGGLQCVLIDDRENWAKLCVGPCCLKSAEERVVYFSTLPSVCTDVLYGEQAILAGRSAAKIPTYLRSTYLVPKLT